MVQKTDADVTPHHGNLHAGGRVSISTLMAMTSSRCADSPSSYRRPRETKEETEGRPPVECPFPEGALLLQ